MIENYEIDRLYTQSIRLPTHPLDCISRRLTNGFYQMNEITKCARDLLAVVVREYLEVYEIQSDTWQSLSDLKQQIALRTTLIVTQLYIALQQFKVARESLETLMTFLPRSMPDRHSRSNILYRRALVDLAVCYAG